MTTEAEIPTQFTHNVKISDTAKGIRIDVHVYANSASEAVHQAFMTYRNAKLEAERLDIPLAPIEVTTK